MKGSMGAIEDGTSVSNTRPPGGNQNYMRAAKAEVT